MNHRLGLLNRRSWRRDIWSLRYVDAEGLVREGGEMKLGYVRSLWRRLWAVYQSPALSGHSDFETHLFTFWPPGPDERLKVTSHAAFWRMVSASRLASHFLAAASSASSVPPPVRVARHLVVRATCFRVGKCGRRRTWRSIT